MIEVWDNKSEAARCVNTKRPLTRSLDSTEEGLAMEATRTCTIDGCDRRHYGRGLCKLHWQRNWRAVPSREASPEPSPCSVDGCDRPVRCRSLCKLHYDRLLRTGATARRAFPDACTIDGCERPHRARGYCDTHWNRWRKHGDPTVVMPNPSEAPGEHNPHWGGDNVTYGTAHDRIRKAKGSAANYPCADCGEVAAAEWAYDHLDADERRSDDGLPYSTKMDHYRPLCRKCHWRADRPNRKAAS